MTDLHGEWLPRILDKQQRTAFFHFLERCNWLIFHDAYAQLLLYAEMKRYDHDLTDVLPRLGVSRFMEPIWRNFLVDHDMVRLTHSLIINEQHYIEQRVVQKPFYQQEVLDTLPFHLQSLLSLNHVLFPYRDQSAESRTRLIGITVHRFASLERRIAMGKTLFQLLRTDKQRFAQIVDWAKRTPHTGSRSDYWPHLFRPVRAKADDQLYSPWLVTTWPDVTHAPADGVDWYRDDTWLTRLGTEKLLPTIDENDYIRSLCVLKAGLALTHPFS